LAQVGSLAGRNHSSLHSLNSVMALLFKGPVLAAVALLSLLSGAAGEDFWPFTSWGWATEKTETESSATAQNLTSNLSVTAETVKESPPSAEHSVLSNQSAPAAVLPKASPTAVEQVSIEHKHSTDQSALSAKSAGESAIKQEHNTPWMPPLPVAPTMQKDSIKAEDASLKNPVSADLKSETAKATPVEAKHNVSAELPVQAQRNASSKLSSESAITADLKDASKHDWQAETAQESPITAQHKHAAKLAWDTEKTSKKNLFRAYVAGKIDMVESAQKSQTIGEQKASSKPSMPVAHVAKKTSIKAEQTVSSKHSVPLQRKVERPAAQSRSLRGTRGSMASLGLPDGLYRIRLGEQKSGFGNQPGGWYLGAMLGNSSAQEDSRSDSSSYVAAFQPGTPAFEQAQTTWLVHHTPGSDEVRISQPNGWYLAAHTDNPKDARDEASSFVQVVKSQAPGIPEHDGQWLLKKTKYGAFKLRLASSSKQLTAYRHTSRDKRGDDATFAFVVDPAARHLVPSDGRWIFEKAH